MLDKLVKICIDTYGVDANKVVCMGYSAGGDGMYRMSCRMADRWAAACAFAGHPGDENPDNLKNTCFCLATGGNDWSYNRNGKG